MNKSILNVLMMLLVCLIPVSSHAFAEPNPNYVLHVKVINATNKKLSFDRVSIIRTGSEYYVTPSAMNPGESAVITVIKSETIHNDIKGHVIFVDPYGNEVPFYIHDQEKVHMGQPVFAIQRTEKYRSEVVKGSKIINPNKGSRYLLVLAVDVRILDRL